MPQPQPSAPTAHHTSSIGKGRVLEFGRFLAAPFAGSILAQMGYEVIKIETPSGDPTRTLVHGGPGGSFLAYGGGKRSVCIDVRSESGREILGQLLRSADVFVHNLSPEATRKLQITGPDCADINPSLVYCHITGYGPGPRQDELASNPVIEASTGVMFNNRVDGRPTRLGPSYQDMFAGTYAVIGILNSLLDRQKSQENPASQPTSINVGLYETGLHVAARDLVAAQQEAQAMAKEGEPAGEFSLPGYGSYQTADGRWVYLVMLTDTHWSGFCSALGVPHDPSLSTVQQRRAQREHVETVVTTAVEAHVFTDLASLLSAHGLGFTEVQPPLAVLDDVQAKEVGKVSQLGYEGNTYAVPVFPVISDTLSRAPITSPPALGADTLEVLRELGYSEADLTSLQSRNVIVGPST